MKKIHKWRPTIFCFSLVCVLSLLLLAFNYTVTGESSQFSVAAFEDEKELEIIRTVHKKPEKSVPPPTRTSVTIEPVIDDEFREPDSTMVVSDPVEPVDTAMVLPIGQGEPPSEPRPHPVLPPEPPAGPIDFPDKMPFFGDCYGLENMERKACSDKSILTFMQDGVRYPRPAREAGIEGTVFIQFVVDREGNLYDFKVLRDIGGGCGAEALRVARSMPKWSPGIQHGRPVAVIFRMPVRFELKE